MLHTADYELKVTPWADSGGRRAECLVMHGSGFEHPRSARYQARILSYLSTSAAANLEPNTNTGAPSGDNRETEAGVA